jgi:nucleoside-triphosphatase
MNILIRGKPGCGKSTLIQKLITLMQQKGKQIGGISTPELREGQRVGFEIVDMRTGERGILAHKNQPNGPRVSQYKVNLSDLDNIGVKGIKKALEKKVDFIIIDEIGKMELVSSAFQEMVWEALESQKVLGTIGQILHPFVTKVYNRTDLKLYILTPQTREQIFTELRVLLQL